MNNFVSLAYLYYRVYVIMYICRIGNTAIADGGVNLKVVVVVEFARVAKVVSGRVVEGIFWQMDGSGGSKTKVVVGWL